MQIEYFKSITRLRNSILATDFRLTINKLESRRSINHFILQGAKELNNQNLIQLDKAAFKTIK